MELRNLRERWAVVSGLPVFFREGGPADGPTILHLHGFAISGSYMTPTADRLAERYRCLVPDLPGFGRSHGLDRTPSIPDLADAAVAFLDSQGVDRATLVGNSMGCPITLSVVERHPDRVERIVLVAPAGGKHNQPLPRAIGQMVLDAPREPIAMAGVAVPDYLNFGFIGALRLFGKLAAFPTLPRLLALSTPALVVLGNRDPLLPPWSRIREIAQQMPVVPDIVVMRDAAHAINYSHPRELAAVIGQYLEGEQLTGLPGDPSASPILHVPGFERGSGESS